VCDRPSVPQALANPEVKALVLTGGVKGFFMAGADITHIKATQEIVRKSAVPRRGARAQPRSHAPGA
jgi:enoyl-CoA hydratase/carnithine racemase